MITLTELPALVADRYARAALKAIDADPDSGIAGLAFQHYAEVAKLPDAHAYLLPFVRGTVAGSEFSLEFHLKGWRNIDRLEQAALMLHVAFLTDREPLDIPVAMQGAALMAGGSDLRVTFCSPAIAAVLNSRHADYVQLETVLSTEDVYNLTECINVEAAREYAARKRDK
ncbi:BcepNY3gp47 [Burkholderia phage BcepNY3]|uniref:Gp48 n=2 Tax=Naesvirus TaxID=2733115 RepID=Q6UIY3_9CAUD|nr:gp48 [Burkholderia phage Bcep1]YP_001294885.1 BcepNY3gp47 [Burkholderia phage BcepNY3]AAQ73395.2 gp48 [Burkholderia phage Bcep1]ABR10582.1 BcepNY3gp47 [Burkholderia phage BcepNY3]